MVIRRRQACELGRAPQDAPRPRKQPRCEIRQVGAIDLNRLRPRIDISARSIFSRKFCEISSQRFFTKNIRWDDLQLQSERSRSQMDNY